MAAATANTRSLFDPGSAGRWFFPEQIEELAGGYEQIAKELKSQYNVGENLVVRTKLGYYAPKPASGE